MASFSCGIDALMFGQLDDVGLGRLGQLAELGEGVADALLGLEVVGERRR